MLHFQSALPTPDADKPAAARKLNTDDESGTEKKPKRAPRKKSHEKEYALMEDMNRNVSTAIQAFVQRNSAPSAPSAAVSTPTADSQEDCITTWARCMTYKLKRLDFAVAHTFMVDCDVKILTLSNDNQSFP